MTRRSPRDCLVIMPFGQGAEAKRWQARYKRIIESAVKGYTRGGQRRPHFRCYRMDTQIQPGSIPDALALQLMTADIVIADLTDANPNVFYELGMRHASRSGTILIAKDASKKPFDVRTELIIPYDIRNPTEAIRNIQRAISYCHDNPGHPDNAALRARLALEEPKVYERWRRKNRYVAPISGDYWIERINRGTPRARDIHFSVFEFRFRQGVLHPFEMMGLSFDAKGGLHSEWSTKYLRVERADDEARTSEREIEVEYVYNARHKGKDRSGYGQCTFLAERGRRFATGGGFYLAGEEHPPRRRDYELHRVDAALLTRLGLERLPSTKGSLSKVVPAIAHALGTGPIEPLPKYAPEPARRPRRRAQTRPR
jgi:hypothetical protein